MYWSVVRALKGVPALAPACMIAFMLAAPVAEAATIKNRDTKDYKVSVVEKVGRSDFDLKAGLALERICLSGCVVRLDDNEDDEYEVGGTEAVIIEDGYIYYDGPSTPREAAAQALDLDGSSSP